MTSIFRFQRSLCCIACVLVLNACATKSPVEQKVVTIEAVMEQANQASQVGQTELALTLLKDASVTFPADAAPWLRMAQMQYEAARYSEAIIDAQQVLARDPSNKFANSIVAVSGLRLSKRALSDLSLQNNLSGSLRTESQDLIKLLRESLGEAVLVPPAPRSKPVASSKPAARSLAKKRAARPVAESSANPFDALK
jgi:tetratricopeptide (TPR) repeat protein